MEIRGFHPNKPNKHSLFTSHFLHFLPIFYKILTVFCWFSIFVTQGGGGFRSLLVGLILLLGMVGGGDGGSRHLFYLDSNSASIPI